MGQYLTNDGNVFQFSPFTTKSNFRLGFQEQLSHTSIWHTIGRVADEPQVTNGIALPPSTEFVDLR
jgi:hypothetical protein